MEMWVIWLIVAGAMFLLEIMTVGFLVIWFGIAALLTMVLSFWVSNIAIQLTFFLILSTILILLSKPLIKKFIQKGEGVANVYTVIGKIALVTKDIDTEKSSGQIKVDSDTWSAKDVDNGFIPIGSKVEILKVEGVRVIVKKID